MPDKPEATKFLQGTDVIIPAHLSGPMLSLLRRYVYENGRWLPTDLVALIEAIALAHAAHVSPRRNQPEPCEIIEVQHRQAWCSTSQAASSTGLSRRRIQQLAQHGAIGSRRVGQRTLEVDLRDLTAYLQERPDAHSTPRTD